LGQISYVCNEFMYVFMSMWRQTGGQQEFQNIRL
jgi:hypothetical protein